jgi:hypothetical protein
MSGLWGTLSVLGAKPDTKKGFTYAKYCGYCRVCRVFADEVREEILRGEREDETQREVVIERLKADCKIRSASASAEGHILVSLTPRKRNLARSSTHSTPTVSTVAIGRTL